MMTMLDAINNIRVRAGLPALRPDAQLTQAATRHVNDLAGGRVTLTPAASHIGSDGSTPADRVLATGYPLADCREMTGWGWQGIADRLIDYWMQSPVHWEIIHRPDLAELGWDYAYNPADAAGWGHYWVVVLARPVGDSGPQLGEHVVYAPVVVALGTGQPAGIDLLDYLRGDGRAYMVQHPDGPSEKFRTVDLGGGRWLQLKNRQWEEFWIDGGMIWRGTDTSASEDTYYRQWESGQRGARWCPARMSVGQTWVSPARHSVQTYRKADCGPLEHHRNGVATNSVTLVARLASMTWNGVTVKDVVHLRTHTGESMWFAKDFGLVAWTSAWGVSAIAHVLPAGEGENEPEVGCFGV